MTRRLWSILAAAACVVASPALAQTGNYGAIAMEIHNNAGHEPSGDPRQTHDAAICLAWRDQAYGILQQLPHSMRESNYVGGAFTHGNDRCFPEGRRLLIGGRFLRGAAAEFLLERPNGPRTDAPIFQMPDAEGLQRQDANIRAPLIFIQIGECAARANPAGVMALLATEVGTPEERTAFNAMVPAMGGCVPGGVTFQLPRLLIRGYLAEGAYRNAVAARRGTH
jgi:hypothetical protein